jgi:hypothetical protein
MNSFAKITIAGILFGLASIPAAEAHPAHGNPGLHAAPVLAPRGTPPAHTPAPRQRAPIAPISPLSF